MQQILFYKIFFGAAYLQLSGGDPINGTNFIDGLNALVLSYYLILLLVLFKLGLLSYIDINDQQIIYLSILLFFLITLNVSNQLFLGDFGSIKPKLGFFLISIYQKCAVNFSIFYLCLYFGILLLKHYFQSLENLD